MAKKKFYAVRRGFKRGIFQSWDECRVQVDRYSGSEFKGFLTLAEAEAYLMEDVPRINIKEQSAIDHSPMLAGNEKCQKRTFFQMTYPQPNTIPSLKTPFVDNVGGFSQGKKQGTIPQSGSRNNPILIDSDSEEFENDDEKASEVTKTSESPESFEFHADSIVENSWGRTGDENGDNSNEEVRLIENVEAPVNYPIRKPSRVVTPTCKGKKVQPIYSSAAQDMMEKMGHVLGKGLGKQEQGISDPIMVENRPVGSTLGIGYVGEKLNRKQQLALDIAKTGKNVFITGPAGTGKSVVLRHIMEYMSETYKHDEWVAVGPTGTVALALGGETLHSFAGCGVPVAVKDFDNAWKKERRTRWRKVRAMLIDEISMFSGEFLDNLSNVVCDIRDDREKKKSRKLDETPREPFGGIQLIICGDFLQLPPISKRKHDVLHMLKTGLQDLATLHLDLGFAFQSSFWKEAKFENVILDEVFRQRNSTFVEILHSIRKGVVKYHTVKFLNQCRRPLPIKANGIKPTRLYSKNINVNSENSRELIRLTGEEFKFQAIDDVIVYDEEGLEINRNLVEEKLWNSCFFDSCTAEKVIHLKANAQVMLIKNHIVEGRRTSLVNGSRGKVVGFTDKLPEGSIVDNGASLLLPGYKEKMMYPIVEFVNGESKVVGPVVFSSRLAGLGECRRTTIPLKLAWAITIHKSQGMTLDYVSVDLAGVFTEAQAYVALSRASDENGLELKNFQPKLVRADRRALDFYDNPNAKFPHWEDIKKVVYEQDEAFIMPPKPIKGCLQGRRFVLIGDLDKYPQEKAKRLVEACGGIVCDTLTEKTNYLVVGRSVGKNYRIAEQIRNGDCVSDLRILRNKRALFALIRSPEITHASNSTPCVEESDQLIPPSPVKGCLSGLSFVFTGELNGFSRDEAENLVKDCGGFARSAVSGKTNYLVVGEFMSDGRSIINGNKYQKAQEIIKGVNASKLKIINNTQGFFTFIRSRQIKTKQLKSNFFSPR